MRSRVTKFDSHGRQVAFWAVAHDLAAAEAARKDRMQKERAQKDEAKKDKAQEDESINDGPWAVDVTPDDSVFVAYFTTGRIEKYSPDGSLVTSWSASENPAGESHPITGFTVSSQFVFTMSAVPPQVHVWTLDGQPRMNADLGVHLGTVPIAAPQIAVTPHSELLVFDPAAPRVFWFRIHLDAPPVTHPQLKDQPNDQSHE
jgi:hypothetical protein